MNNTPLEMIIFAIDNDTDTHTVARFLRAMSQAIALGKMDAMHHMIGCYEGKLEKSYMIQARHLDLIQPYILKQESILRVPGDTRQPCTLEYPEDQSVVHLGPMRRASAGEALDSPAWTYNIATNTYYIC